MIWTEILKNTGRKERVVDMTEVKPCPQCKEVPIIGYCCGEHFVMPLKAPVGACVCSSFTEMHSSEETEIKAWNKHVEEMVGEYE